MTQNQSSRSLYDGSSSYKIEKFLGKGTFAKVVQCKTSSTKEKMAVKMVHENYGFHAQREVAILEEIRKLDADKNNLVKLSHHFIFDRRDCLAFEMLDMDLYEMIIRRPFVPLNLSQIRVITQQMLVALNALKSIGLIHADIKPNNIMLVNHKSYPFKVKLIDFGLGRKVSTIKQGSKIQNICYRAPEVILGLPLNEAVDMWSLACVLAFLYLGKDLYPKHQYEAMRLITQINGQLDDHLMSGGLYTMDYFTKDSPTAPLRLKTRHEYKRATGCKNELYWGFSTKLTSLDDITKICWGKKIGTKYEDNQAFLSLLKHMLQVDPKKRITPSEALGHRFITMKHFPSDIKDKYVKSAFSTVDKCMLWQPSEIRRFVPSSEVVSQNEEDITCLDDTHPADEEPTVETNNGPPATDGLNETTTAGADKTLHVTNVAPPSGSHGPPARDGLDETTTVGDYKKQPETTDATLSSSGPHGPPARDGLNETTAAGDYKKQPETTDATSSSPGFHGPPARDGLNETTAAGDYKKQPETTDATSSSPGSHGPPARDGLNETTAAGDYKKQPETTDATSSSPGSHGPPARDGLDETTTAGDNKIPETTDATSSSSDSQGPTATDGVNETTAAGDNKIPETTDAMSSSNGVNMSNDKGHRKVKRWRKWFSNLAKMFTCKHVDVIE